MKHLEEHPHAFIKNGIVTDIAIFDETAHDSELIDAIKIDKGSEAVICLCNYGSIPKLYSIWNNSIFIDPELSETPNS